ncbi:YiiX/YebB-like N1pC/P60 family cysteine hydrolase [Maliponia aquimaris]|uniref:YiiX/YebB-like N1pC/P60 family cysteine hydrolase n=1 Tax=Maliponia aquimaris TaxID=1673631 RepID=UPI000B8A7152|nr:YiiX/YebB-like N1pC/P60 family cysteine hydrolase [Maliponia aquimaris]
MAAVLAGLLAGCAAPPLSDAPVPDRPAAEILSGCCTGDLPYPDWLIRLADANVEPIRAVGKIQFRPGRMTRQPELAALLESELRPLDMLFFHSDNRVSGHLLPGQFTHGAVYVGSEAKLRAAGLWDLPALRPWQGHIRGGAVYLEAVDGGVRLSPPGIVLDTDAVVALRPRGIDRAVSLRRGLAQMGVPFDMHFDAGDRSQLFCAELIALMLPEAELPRTPVHGRVTILPDAVVAGVLTRDLPFQLVGYVEATPGGGARVQPPQLLAWHIRRAWPGAR